MSDLGPVSYEESKGLSFLGKDMVEGKQYSEDSAKSIDQQVYKILFECHEKCKNIINKYRSDLDIIAHSLIEKEILEYEEFRLLTSHIETV